MQTETVTEQASPSECLSKYAMTAESENDQDARYIDGFNAALKLAECYIAEELENELKIGRAWLSDSSLEKWFPITAETMRAIEWIRAGKYRTIQHRHDGTYRLTDEALNIWADGDSLEGIVNCEHWKEFRDCTEKAP